MCEIAFLMPSKWSFSWRFLKSLTVVAQAPPTWYCCRSIFYSVQTLNLAEILKDIWVPFSFWLGFTVDNGGDKGETVFWHGLSSYTQDIEGPCSPRLQLWWSATPQNSFNLDTFSSLATSDPGQDLTAASPCMLCHPLVKPIPLLYFIF